MSDNFSLDAAQSMGFLVQLKKSRIMSRRDLVYRIRRRSCKTDIKSIMKATKKMESCAFLSF